VVVRQVEGNDPEAIRHLGVVEQVTILPAVGTGRVQAQQRDAATRLLDEDARQLRPRWNPGELWFDRLFFAVAA